MELSTVVVILIVLAAAMLLMKFIGKMFSFALSVIGIVAVVWLVVIGLRWMDENSIRENMIESNSLFLLSDGDNLMTGFATQEGMPDPDIAEVSKELADPDSDIYDDYYRVFIVKKDALPEKTSVLVDVVGAEDRKELFRHYVENSLLEGDFVGNLVNKEKQGDIEVREETLAFRHGVAEVLSP
ncbi:hypothetical protein JW898_05105 [Candidatus Woesearchaeota archaeon]|nr:hypothetical protein [Candidatus Woesearchaeota archaeon]